VRSTAARFRLTGKILLLPVAVFAPLLFACSERARRVERADDDSISVLGDTAEAGADTARLPDERILNQTISRRIVVFVEASDADLEAMRDRYSEEDFAVVADDLMFYRSTAIEYLEERHYPLLRIEGRRPLRFRVSGESRLLDLSDSQLPDLIVLYEPEREPRVISPNEVELTTNYFSEVH
jgi:hypothetical protein